MADKMVKTDTHPTNMRMCVLQVMGIFMMVEAHAGASSLDLGGLFQYYSFHMPLFVFISGYFYSAGENESFFSFVARKFKRLMLPYFIWNLIYGLWAAFLRSRGFSFGEPMSLYTLLIAPFTDGYQFILNHTAWFIPAIFLEELFFYPIYRFIKGKAFNVRMAFALFICSAIGCGGIAIGLYTDRSGCLLMLSRLFVMLPFFYAGWLYKEKIEAGDTSPSWLYLGLCLLITLILTVTGNNRIYSLARCTGFPGYLVTFVITFNGIAFWLRISKILEPAFAAGGLMEYMGRNTYPIVMHHLPVLFLINSFYALCASTGRVFGNFDMAAYHSDIYYMYFPREMHQMRIFYILIMIFVPLAVHAGISCLCRKKSMKRKA